MQKYVKTFSYFHQGIYNTLKLDHELTSNKLFNVTFLSAQWLMKFKLMVF